MARINIANSILGVVVGGADEALERRDAREGVVEPFKGWTGWYRIGATALGLLGVSMNMFAKYAEPLTQSTLPLLTKSVSQQFMKPGVGTRPTRTRTAVAQRWPAPAQEPEFRGIRLA